MPQRRPLAALTLLLGVGGVAVLDARTGGSLVDTGWATLGEVAGGYVVGAWLRPAAAAGATLTTAALLTTANRWAGSPYSMVNDYFFFAVLLGAAALAGALITARRSQVRELRRLTALLVEQRAGEVRVAALDERNRLEAEVAQRLMQRIGAVVVQVAGARVRPEPGALARIEEAGRSALDDLRATLGSLRSPDAAAPEPPRPVTTRPPASPPGTVDLLVGLCGVPVTVEAFATSGSWVAVLAVLIGVPLVWRRRHVVAALVTSYAASVLVGLLVVPLAELATPLLPLSLTGYAVGAHARGRARLAGTAVLLGGSILVTFAGSPSFEPGDGLLPVLVWLALAMLAGAVARRHLERAAEQRRLLADLEAGRGGQLRLAAAEQRQAVARDLHDTVAHAMTVVCLHAEAAQRLVDPSSSLAVAETAAREAMTQLRAGLAALQDGSDLAEEARAFGATLGLSVTVADSAGDPGAALEPARRVVREALVNVARHAAGAPVSVLVERHDDVLELEVRNALSTAAPFTGGAGAGLAGLAELVAVHGGRLEHGPVPDGGYRVTAHLLTRTTVPV